MEGGVGLCISIGFERISNKVEISIGGLFMKLTGFFLRVLLLILFSMPCMGTTLVVNPDGSGDAITIQEGINAAVSGVDEVVVASGTYLEAINFNGKAITLRSSNPDDPNVVAATIISTTANDTDVVTCDSGEGSNTILSGFTIIASGDSSDGMYNGYSSPTVTRCNFSSNSRIGMDNYWSSSPTVTNCTFSGNEYGFYNDDHCSPTVTNCILTGNDIGMYNEWACDPTMTNCTLTGNDAGMINIISDPTMTNCILWDNIDNMLNVSGSLTATYSLVEGGHTGTGNIDADPLFVDPNNGDYHLQACSPCINAGSNTPVVEPLDLDGNPRIIDITVDMGAYEYPDVLLDSDSDGVPDACDSHPSNPNLCRDLDNDGCDDCSSGTVDPANDGTDTDGDGMCDVGDTDDDNDGVEDHLDSDPLDRFICQDSDGDGCDDCSSGTVDPANDGPDGDGDGICDAGDTPSVHNITQSTNFYTIQAAINDPSTVTGDEVVVAPGTYREAVNFNGKAITLRSSDPDNPNVVAATIISTTASETDVVTCDSGEGANTILSGFTLTASGTTSSCMYNYDSSPTVTNCILKRLNNLGKGMYNYRRYNNCNPTVTNCTFSGNREGMYNHNSSPIVTNCIFRGNGRGMVTGSYPMVINCTFSGNDTGLWYDAGNPIVTNCILWGNTYDNIDGIINEPTVTYSLVGGGWPGTGNIDADPLFVNPSTGDYHLQDNSPCIDAGDPAYQPVGETDIDGDPRVMDSYVDMGIDETFPTNCMRKAHPDYAKWVEYGKPDCWCYRKQCKGDIDGEAQFGGAVDVYTNDTDILIPAFGAGVVTTVPGVCADVDHGTQFGGAVNVYTNDLNILLSNFGAGVLTDCDSTHFNFWITP